ncbi:MAG: U32 family peptidase [Candidatus Cloacimonetes bacterium]|nr:U32 family peptidase [Candidatus Cloacimonadota bacterium]
MAVNYDVPALFSELYLKSLSDILTLSDDNIKSVYGSARIGSIGQARFSEKIPILSFEELSYFVNAFASMGVDFHYTLNSPWTNLLERLPNHKSKIIENIEFLLKAGIKTFIVANPYLISMIKHICPDSSIVASINMQTSSFFKFDSLLNYGCSSVVFDRTINRNIHFLKSITKYSDNYSLLVNSICLFDCPLQQYHANENGFRSSLNDIEIDEELYCNQYCNSTLKAQQYNILKSTWIRPEDISRYEEIGVKNFKIQGRTLESDVLISIIRSYLLRKTSDNRLFHIFPGLEYDFPELNNKLLNTKIDDLNFIDYFFNNKLNCSTDCNSCNHCLKTFNKL